MRPAFSSTKSAAGFTALVLGILLLPVIIPIAWLPPRASLYSTIPWNYGAFPFIREQIFERKDKLDIAFIGSSRVWFDIDSPYVAHELTHQMGRSANVVTLGWSWPGFDATYCVAADLLGNRKVDLLVIYNEKPVQNMPHPISAHWFRWADDPEAREGLSWPLQAGLYTSGIISLPLSLMGLARANLPLSPISDTPNFQEKLYHAPNPATRLGTLSSRLALNANPDFVELHPPVLSRNQAVQIYSPAMPGAFRFDQPPMPAFQDHYLRELLAKAHKKGTKVVMLYLPTPEEARWQVMHLQSNLQDLAAGPLTVMGIPPAELFAGISEADFKQLFCDLLHLNANGQAFYTQVITPKLLQVYADQTHLH